MITDPKAEPGVFLLIRAQGPEPAGVVPARENNNQDVNEGLKSIEHRGVYGAKRRKLSV